MFKFNSRDAEYLEEDGETSKSLPICNPSQNLNENFEVIDDWEQCDNFNEIIEYTPDCDVVCQHLDSQNTQRGQENVENILKVCTKCTQLEVELQKSKTAVEKLQKRCKEKAAEIKRLRAAEKRSRTAKSSLEEILCELKNEKWISNEGQAVLNVNSFTL